MGLNGTKRWLDDLPELTNELNHTKHSRYKKFVPASVNESNEKLIFEKFYSNVRPVGVPNFKINQKVRVQEAYATELFRKS